MSLPREIALWLLVAALGFAGVYLLVRVVAWLEMGPGGAL